MLAEKKFWQSPDLVFHLLAFLDLPSILALANLLPLLRRLLQRKTIWRGLVLNNIEGPMGYEIEAREHEENCRNVKQLVGILKMLQSPESLLQDLLDAIVDIFDDADEEAVELLELEEAYLLSLTCRHHLVHDIWHEEAFGLLELAEGMMGTCLQPKRTFSADTTTDLDHWPRDIFKQAVASRLARQTELI